MPQTQHKCLELVLGADAAGAGARRALRARSAAGRCARAPAGVYINPTATTTTTSKRRAHRAVGAADGGGDAAEEAALALHAVHLAPRAQELPHLLLACARRRPHDKAVASDTQRSPPAGRLRPGRLARYAGTCAPACTGRAPPPRIRAGSRRARRARAGRAQASCASASTAPRYASSCRRRSSTNSPLWLCGKMRLAGRRRRYAGTPRSARCSASKLRKRRDTVHSASASATRTCAPRAAPAGAPPRARRREASAAPGRQADDRRKWALDIRPRQSPGHGRRSQVTRGWGAAPNREEPPSGRQQRAARLVHHHILAALAVQLGGHHLRAAAATARLSASSGRAADCTHGGPARRPAVHRRAARARAHCTRAGALRQAARARVARAGARALASGRPEKPRRRRASPSRASRLLARLPRLPGSAAASLGTDGSALTASRGLGMAACAPPPCASAPAALSSARGRSALRGSGPGLGGALPSSERRAAARAPRPDPTCRPSAGRKRGNADGRRGACALQGEDARRSPDGMRGPARRR